uniref:Uncharacterized protein n=1 Tax=uncultured nuHF1 cluster bacterium HF0130_31E21 TaxID=710728 RepID=E0XTL9_9BACT|nr:hypothetical protein [uncultured nuHF1 cluster bacterium HF0130_31E21]
MYREFSMTKLIAVNQPHSMRLPYQIMSPSNRRVILGPVKHVCHTT